MDNKNQIKLFLQDALGCDIAKASDQDLYYALLSYVKEQTEKLPTPDFKKKYITYLVNF